MKPFIVITSDPNISNKNPYLVITNRVFFLMLVFFNILLQVIRFGRQHSAETKKIVKRAKYFR